MAVTIEHQQAEQGAAELRVILLAFNPSETTRKKGLEIASEIEKQVKVVKKKPSEGCDGNHTLRHAPLCAVYSARRTCNGGQGDESLSQIPFLNLKRKKQNPESPESVMKP